MIVRLPAVESFLTRSSRCLPLAKECILTVPFSKEEAKRRREKVLKVAFKLFVKNSIEAVSMQQIADAAEVGVASVFRYYVNKTDLVIAVSA